MKKLNNKQTIGLIIGASALAMFVLPNFAKGNTNTDQTGDEPNPNNSNTGTGTKKPTVDDILKIGSEAAYTFNVILKGKGFADMQRFLQAAIPEGANRNYANYAGLMMVGSGITGGGNIHVRKSPGVGGASIKTINNNEGVGKSTGRFFKVGGLVWAEITLIPPFVKVPLAPITTGYVALGYLKSNSPINNTISGFKGLGCCQCKSTQNLSGFTNLLN